MNKKIIYDLFNEQKSFDFLVKQLKVKKVLFIFNCGIGDFLMFMDVVQHFKKKYPYIQFKIGALKELGYHFISEDIVFLEENENNHYNSLLNFYLQEPLKKYSNILDLSNEYDMIINVKFFEPICRKEFKYNCNITKAEYCMKYEFKIDDDFKLGYKGFCPEYKINKKIQNACKNKKIIGIHGIGNSGNNNNKNIDIKELKIIKDSIIKKGYKPLLIYNTDYKFFQKNYKYDISSFKYDEIIDQESDLGDIANYISCCNFFIGVLSGPLIMANKILSPERCVAIEKINAHPWFSFKKIVGDNILLIKNINMDDVIGLIKRMEERSIIREKISINNYKTKLEIKNMKIFKEEIPLKEIKLKEDCLSWMENDVIYVHSWPGVGDNYWIYNKLKNLNKRIHFLFNYKNEILYPKRSHQLMEFCPNSSFSYYLSNDNKLYDIYVNAFPENFKKEQILEELNKGSKYSFLPNRYMEIGTHLKDIWKDLGLYCDIIDFKDFDVNNVDDFHRNTVFIHPFTYNKDRSNWVDLSINMIQKLSIRLNNNEFKIGLCGGLYDCDNWDVIFDLIKNEIGYKPYNLIGKSLLDTLHVLSLSSGWIGPINGLSAITTFNNINSCVIWPQYLHKMTPTITNPYGDPRLYKSYLSEKGIYNRKNQIQERKIMDNFINHFKKLYKDI